MSRHRTKNGFRTCLTCRVVKPAADFLSLPKEPGRTSPHLFCISCGQPPPRPTWTPAESEGRYRTRREFVDGLKNVPCAQCGKKFASPSMQFDHIRGEKKFNLSSAAGRSIPQREVLEEAEKCEVVCANCHHTRTFNRHHERKPGYSCLPYGPLP